ncbi:dihydroorotate dehydrogenase (quinone) [Candidatus Pacearchaeota archaeon]|nr:dihydroorotate dehydrogenase (quinone) [Candidatus Pacearchaeota archaeon]|tara:strand:- start:1494 stop:2615 length:1122 start_codon:yes stop_codon:yes gene_type:complete
MKESLISIRNNILKFHYKNIAKPIFFKIPPEIVHDHTTNLGKKLGSNSLTRSLTSNLFNYKNKKLEQKILGIHFKNPIGLAAGFDKDAQLTDILPSVGFGFEEIGSITGEQCHGNPKPRLWRLINSKSLVVYYGLKNQGCQKIAKRIKNKSFKIPILISIAKTNSKSTVLTKNGITDYTKAYKEFANIGDASVINISCPNTFGGEPFHDTKKLDQLLKKLKEVHSTKPLFIKISPDLNEKELDNIITVARKYKIAGFICTNLSKNRQNIKLQDNVIHTKGGISGKPIENKSNKIISFIYKKTKGEFIIIGVGGVDSAKSAYKKICLGASLVQLITGMIYEGPQLISEINQGLVKLLEKDGLKNISEAIGKDSN